MLFVHNLIQVNYIKVLNQAKTYTFYFSEVCCSRSLAALHGWVKVYGIAFHSSVPPKAGVSPLTKSESVIDGYVYLFYLALA